MVIRRWYPFNELRRMQENMDQLWQDFVPPNPSGAGMEEWAIPLDVVQEEKQVVVRASVPGVNPADLNVTIENDVLTIRGQTSGESERQEGNYLMRERHTGSFHRSLRLLDTLDVDRADSRYENGVLTIALPRLEARQSRQLQITTTSSDRNTVDEAKNS